MGTKQRLENMERALNGMSHALSRLIDVSLRLERGQERLLESALDRIVETTMVQHGFPEQASVHRRAAGLDTLSNRADEVEGEDDSGEDGPLEDPWGAGITVLELREQE